MDLTLMHNLNYLYEIALETSTQNSSKCQVKSNAGCAIALLMHFFFNNVEGVTS